MLHGYQLKCNNFRSMPNILMKKSNEKLIKLSLSFIYFAEVFPKFARRFKIFQKFGHFHHYFS